ncbi:hypothetical protein HDV05_003205 [Chytridiales sp. JEL 0842]|nr:hypothetical protein HDV05_003205 [Chytridiales sp. JEL 0842]
MVCTMEWSKPELSSAAPTPRSGHASVIWDSNKMVTFGGETDSELTSSIPKRQRRESRARSSNNGSKLVADVWIFNLESETWTLCTPELGTPIPSPRAYPSLSVFENQVYMFGGNSTPEMWILELGPPPAPGPLELEDVTAEGELVLKWADPFRYQHRRHVRLEIREESEEEWKVSVDRLDCGAGKVVVSGLKGEGVYEFRVVGVNALGIRCSEDVERVLLGEREGSFTDVLKVDMATAKPTKPFQINVSASMNITDPSKCSLIMFWNSASDVIPNLATDSQESYTIQCSASVRLDDMELIPILESEDRIVKKRSSTSMSDSELMQENLQLIHEARERGETIDCFEEVSTLTDGSEWFGVWEGENAYMDLAYDELWSRSEVLEAYKRCVVRAAERLASKAKAPPPSLKGAVGGLVGALTVEVGTGLDEKGAATDLWPTKNVVIAYKFRAVINVNTDDNSDASRKRVFSLESAPIEWRHPKVYVAPKVNASAAALVLTPQEEGFPMNVEQALQEAVAAAAESATIERPESPTRPPRISTDVSKPGGPETPSRAVLGDSSIHDTRKTSNPNPGSNTPPHRVRTVSVASQASLSNHNLSSMSPLFPSSSQHLHLSGSSLPPSLAVSSTSQPPSLDDVFDFGNLQSLSTFSNSWMNVDDPMDPRYHDLQDLDDDSLNEDELIVSKLAKVVAAANAETAAVTVSTTSVSSTSANAPFVLKSSSAMDIDSGCAPLVEESPEALSVEDVLKQMAKLAEDSTAPSSTPPLVAEALPAPTESHQQEEPVVGLSNVPVPPSVGGVLALPGIPATPAPVEPVAQPDLVLATSESSAQPVVEPSNSVAPVQAEENPAPTPSIPSIAKAVTSVKRKHKEGEDSSQSPKKVRRLKAELPSRHTERRIKKVVYAEPDSDEDDDSDDQMDEDLVGGASNPADEKVEEDDDFQPVLKPGMSLGERVRNGSVEAVARSSPQKPVRKRAKVSVGADHVPASASGEESVTVTEPAAAAAASKAEDVDLHAAVDVDAVLAAVVLSGTAAADRPSTLVVPETPPTPPTGATPSVPSIPVTTGVVPEVPTVPQPSTGSNTQVNLASLLDLDDRRQPAEDLVEDDVNTDLGLEDLPMEGIFSDDESPQKVEAGKPKVVLVSDKESLAGSEEEEKEAAATAVVDSILEAEKDVEPLAAVDDSSASDSPIDTSALDSHPTPAAAPSAVIDDINNGNVVAESPDSTSISDWQVGDENAPWYARLKYGEHLDLYSTSEQVWHCGRCVYYTTYSNSPKIFISVHYDGYPKRYDLTLDIHNPEEMKLMRPYSGLKPLEEVAKFAKQEIWDIKDKNSYKLSGYTRVMREAVSEGKLIRSDKPCPKGLIP